MTSNATTVEQYINELPAERKTVISALRSEILKNLPKGFKEEMGYGMIGYVVPHTLYPGGYHCDPSKPLPFANIASQKNFIAFYHMGIYAKPELLKWFLDEYAALNIGKPDMGQSCIRFKKIDQVPIKLFGKLIKKISVEDWIKIFEAVVKDSRKEKAVKKTAK